MPINSDDASGSARVAVLVDCDNTTPDALSHALRAVARFGRIVVRRGYGNHGTLTAKWRESLVDHAFTPHLQFQYAAGKNTADIAMALDALELLWDDRADTFCLVTSDSDFAYLCRKLRERGAAVCIVGEGKTPDALRNASDQFFELELLKAEIAGETRGHERGGRGNVDSAFALIGAAVATLAADSSDGWVNLSSVSGYIKRTDPGFDPKRFGFSRFRDLVKAHRRLDARQDGGQWWLRQKEEQAPEPRSQRRHDDSRGGETPAAEAASAEPQVQRERHPEARVADQPPGTEATTAGERSGRRRQRGGKRGGEVQFSVGPAVTPADFEAPVVEVMRDAVAPAADAAPVVEAVTAPAAPAAEPPPADKDDAAAPRPRSGARASARRGGKSRTPAAGAPAAADPTAEAPAAAIASAEPVAAGGRGRSPRRQAADGAAEAAAKPARTRRKTPVPAA